MSVQHSSIQFPILKSPRDVHQKVCRQAGGKDLIFIQLVKAHLELRGSLPGDSLDLNGNGRFQSVQNTDHQRSISWNYRFYHHGFYRFYHGFSMFFLTTGFYTFDFHGIWVEHISVQVPGSQPTLRVLQLFESKRFFSWCRVDGHCCCVESFRLRSSRSNIVCVQSFIYIYVCIHIITYNYI